MKISTHITDRQIASLQMGLCISMAFCIGVSIEIAMHIERGYWIPMTIANIFMTVDQGQGAIIKKSVDRVIGTFIGVMVGFLYLNIFMASNYVWVYMLPLIWFACFYFFFVTGNYSIYSMMLTLFLPILLAISSEGPVASLGMGTTLFMRLSCTVIGSLVALASIYAIYKNTLTAAPVLKRNAIEMFKTQADIISTTTACYLGFKEFEKNLIDHIWKQNSSMASIETLYLSIRYEFDDRNDRKEFYKKLFTHVARINTCSRKITGIIVHDRYSGHLSTIDELKDIVGQLSEKYSNMLQTRGAKPDDCTERIDSILNNMNPALRFTSDYIFLKVIREFSAEADNLSIALYPPDSSPAQAAKISVPS